MIGMLKKNLVAVGEEGAEGAAPWLNNSGGQGRGCGSESGRHKEGRGSVAKRVGGAE